MREKQILEEEKQTGHFSPHFGIRACVPLDDEEFDHLGDANNSSFTISESSRGGSHENMLLHTVVLNCGHVYCEICIIKPTDEQLWCQVCECLTPRGFPKVCLELDHFLEQQFREEYALRRDAAQLKKIQLNHESATMCFSNNRGKIQMHGLCGSYRLRSLWDCHNTRSKRPGRFNQQHAPEHRLEHVRSNIVCDVLLRLVTEPLQDVSTAFAAAYDVSGNGSSITFPIHDQECSTDG